MVNTIIEQLADFTFATDFDLLSPDAIEESKRIVLDSIGCALAAIDQPKGKIGIEFGRILGDGKDRNATIIGTADRVSIFGAAFANGELINALDMDAVLPPGHVSPYVLPVIFAVGEAQGATGAAIINAAAVAHEISFRIGKAMDYLRDTKDGQVSPPAVYGYSSTIFGATAAVAKLRGLSPVVTANALGVAASISPVNSQIAWFQHAPSSTLKYPLAGTLAQSALTSSYMAELGHRGNVDILDDREFGYARFIGTKRWDAGNITQGIGEEWLFPAHVSYKPYPHCRILHALLDCEARLVEENNIKPNEIESIKVWVEGFVEQPVWLNRRIEHVHDAQFSIAHGIAVGALGLKPGKAWQDPEIVFGAETLALMDRVTHEVHPDYVKLLTRNAASRPAKIEMVARGQTFTAKSTYPKGSRSPDAESYMTTEQVVEKFLHNAQDILSASAASNVADMILNLENITSFKSVIRTLGPQS